MQLETMFNKYSVVSSGLKYRIRIEPKYPSLEGSYSSFIGSKKDCENILLLIEYSLQHEDVEITLPIHQCDAK